MSRAPSPFPTAARKKVVVTHIEPDMLKVEHNTPIPGHRTHADYKYDPVFLQLRPGNSVKCEPREVGTLAQALRKGLENGRYPAIAGCKVISRRNCPDGHGRV